ncbi:outer membrane beta-barrel protein [Rubellicoccus peritrichatus]|uniref:Uncharacterized protein n=1 Tax=Rubellicoccus peritrichatus TaxID=3080537 RepID=A0AAQ3L9H0_9BACT|nr:hypothetical protein [Puniceicoccus sp. CR14]WOO41306.1 hypothetical protein RZN69_22020 [Puniceicoccus sp. CR14]
MKKLATFLAMASLPGMALLTPSSAAPLVSIGDSVDVFFRGSVSGQYRSNVFNNPLKADDYIFIFSPGLEVNIGRNSNANIKIIFREDISWYNRFTNQDSQLANLFIDGVYNSGPLTSGAGFSFVQNQQNTASTAGVATGTNQNEVQRDLYAAYIKAEYDISQKTYTTGRFEWNRTDYTNNQDFGNSFSDRDIFTAPLDVLYRFSPKLDLGLGYRFRYTDVSNNQSNPALGSQTPGDYLDNFVSFSVRGELYPKLTTRLNVGWQNRSFNAAGLNDDNTISVLSAFDYEFSPKLDFTAGFNRDFGTGSIGQSTINTGGFFGTTYNFSQFIAVSSRIDVVNTDYENDPSGRSDDTIRANTSVTYTPNVYLQFTAAYAYINNSSNINGASFMGHTIDLSASLRY